MSNQPSNITGSITVDANLRGSLSSPGQIKASVISSGPPGPSGLSAYELWLQIGNEGTLEDFLSEYGGSNNSEPYLHPETHSADMIIPTENRQFLTTHEKEKVLQNFMHEQTEASLEWIVLHDLNKYPSVTIVDSAGSVVIGSVEYISKDIILLTFTAEFSGKAYLN